ncbi:hypothetical protein K0M31_001609 [Melipona bicolor]|uniref:Odorant receptor n=1 Tax=Melipona bicolor TaxID=60889 RepID=A0AA40GFX9_9HYME|nr:hypothetical protein K0M31_001609 [Melipona bicolor]
MMGSIYQLLMFTYSCDTLIRDSSNVGIAVYGSLWSLLPMDKYGKMLRRDMMLVILRSKTPCCLTASGFFIISLETYTREATYTASTAIPILIATVKAITFTVQKSEVTWLLERSQKYFWYKKYNAFEKRIMDKLDKKSMLYMGSYTFFLYGTAVVYTVYPLFANIGKTGEDRILPFHFRLFEVPSTRTPYYEVIFGVEVMSTLHTGICFCCFDNLLCILTLHVAGQFKILQNRLETIFGNFSEEKSFETYEEFKECIIYHHLLITYVEKLECVFCFPLMFQLLMSSIVLCLSGFQLTMASEELVKKYLFLSYAISGIVQVYMITRSCDDIMEESSSVGNALYNCNWERTSYIMFNKLRKDMIIVMIRTKYPCYLTAAKFFPISLKSFTNVST